MMLIWLQALFYEIRGTLWGAYANILISRRDRALLRLDEIERELEALRARDL